MLAQWLCGYPRPGVHRMTFLHEGESLLHGQLALGMTCSVRLPAIDVPYTTCTTAARTTPNMLSAAFTCLPWSIGDAGMRGPESSHANFQRRRDA